MIILDIETKNLEPIGNGLQFGNPQNWKTSCACIIEVVGPTAQDIEPHVFVEKDMVAELTSMGIQCKSFEHLPDYLENCLEDELPLLTHNGIGFDLAYDCVGGEYFVKLISSYSDIKDSVFLCS